MSKFPIIEELGLEVYRYPKWSGGEFNDHMVKASDLERLLSQAPVVYGPPHGGAWSERPVISTDTHTARLIGVKEIKKDTAESLLKELIYRWGNGGETAIEIGNDLVNRASALLEGKE